MDPSVKKIINNGGFIAALAPVLAVRSDWHPIRVAARQLGEVAAAYSKMLAAVGIATSVTSDWEGCDQAKLLILWTEDHGPASSVSDKVEQMSNWSDTIWSAIADLAAGKIPPR